MDTLDGGAWDQTLPWLQGVSSPVANVHGDEEAHSLTWSLGSAWFSSRTRDPAGARGNLGQLASLPTSKVKSLFSLLNTLAMKLGSLPQLGQHSTRNPSGPQDLEQRSNSHYVFVWL